MQYRLQVNVWDRSTVSRGHLRAAAPHGEGFLLDDGSPGPSRTHLHDLDDEEAHRLMDEIMETPLDSDIEDEMDEAPDVEDPLDQVVHSILTKHVESPTARRQFADMIAPRKPPVPQTIEIKGRSRTSDSWKGDGASSPGEDDEAVGAAATFIVKAPPPAPRRHPARSCSAARSLPLS